MFGENGHIKFSVITNPTDEDDVKHLETISEIICVLILKGKQNIADEEERRKTFFENRKKVVRKTRTKKTALPIKIGNDDDTENDE